jgi:hypothetical protein
MDGKLIAGSPGGGFLQVRTVAVWIAMGLAFSPTQLFPQVLMRPVSPGGTVNLIGSDAAVLDTEEIKKDLPCTVTPVKPILGFDLRFHSGYEIQLPLRELAGDGDALTIIFRVTSASAKETPYYFNQKYKVPEIDADAKGDAYLDGGFDIGEGDYHVDWMMRNREERVCSSNWDVTAALSSRDQGVKLAITPTAIEASDAEFFKEDPPVARVRSDDALKVKVLINFAPQQSFASTMLPVDISALVSILRNISREPKIYKFSVVAFNMNDQRVVYRQDDADQIDFPALGKALGSLKLGMVDYKLLSEPNSSGLFLTRLIGDELANNSSDAVIFAGPKVNLESNSTLDGLKELPTVPYPVFYMNYNLAPQQNPWRDSIGTVVKRLRGYEYTISRPRDLWSSWSDIMLRISKMKLVVASPTSSH